MHIVAQISDPFPFGSSTISVDYKQEAYSSLSDAASSNTTKPHWDEEDEVILATSRPKKRAGRRIFRETRHPVFRGVRRRNGNKWVCELREPNKKTRIWLGTYSTPEMAARAHDVAALALRGKSACLNFADSVWRLPVPISNDAGDIRKAAAEAAEMFRPLSPRCHQELSSSKEACSEETLKNAVEQENNNVLFVDEEATFDMPRLLTDMAHGLLLSPPHCAGGGFGWDDEVFMETDADLLSLWNF